MKRYLIYIVSSLLSMGILVPVMMAQDARTYSLAKMDSILNPSLATDAHKLLRFEADVLRIGNLNDTDAPKTYEFRFTNISRNPVTISRVNTNCGCTVAEYPRHPIAVGATAILQVTYNPQNRPGTIDTNVFVYLANHGNRPIAKLTLLGNVRQSDEWDYLPVVMGNLRLKRSKVKFTELSVGGMSTMRVLCANTGQRPLRLSASMLPPYAAFSTQPTIIAPGKEADIVITIDGKKLSQSVHKHTFSFLIEGVKGRPSERMMEVDLMVNDK